MALGNISFTLLSFFYILILTIVYFSKPRIKNRETKIYNLIILTCMIGVTLSLGTYYFMVNLDKFPILNYLFSKLYLIFILTYLFFMTLYVLHISLLNSNKIEENYKKHKYLFLGIILLMFLSLLIAIVILPINYVSENKIVYSYGTSVSLTYTITRVVAVAWIIILIIRHKHISWHKNIPMLAYIILGSIISIIQRNNPELLLSTAMIVFVTFLMYFTIENPDAKLIEELNVAKDQAEKANNAKTDFLSNMSHEIRTPLNAIVGFSNGLLEDNNIPEESKEDIKNIITASDNLIELVNGILDISKIEANKLEIINTNYNFKKLFNELLILTKARLGEKPLELKYYYDETIPEYLYGDVSRIKQIIINLLTNSVKYTKEGYIYFKVNAIKKENIIRLIISVEDTGIGIKQENIDKLFTKFERLGVEKNTTTEGTGLGLAITKKLVELMNGKIIVQSIYGKGSKFTVSIDQRISNQKEIENIKKETETKITHENIDITNKKILIVDDNNLNLKVAERLLKKYTQNIHTASSGQECLEKINNNEKFDLILLDDMMPKMSGTLTLEKLKENENFKTPVVVLTANAISGMKEQYLSKGFDDYLSKPIEKGELIRVIKKFLS